MKRSYCLALLFAMIFSGASAQYSRHIVQFKSKKSNFTLANPSAYLSPKAIERRSKQNIIIDSTDLPINPAYLDSIRAVPNVIILNTSKWLNQVCIRTTDDAAAITKINSFSFVKTVAPVAAKTSSGKTREKNETITESSIGRSISTSASNATSVLNYGNTQNQIKIHKGEYLHDRGFTGEGMTIAVLDAGFLGYKTNPAFDSVRLQNRIVGEWDFVANEASVNEDHSHGMHCLSIIAANRPGIMVGSAPKAKFYLFRTEDAASEYPIEEQNWAAAAERADSLGVDIISSSLGYVDFDDHTFDHTHAQRNGNTAMITIAADLAAKKGIIVANSAGNSGQYPGEAKYVGCPADGDSVLAVGATDVNGNMAPFSSWGPNGAGKPKPNVVSVGWGTTIAWLDGNPVTGNGTSFSNPNMAGLVTCLWQAFPELSNMTILDAVQKSAHKYNSPDDRFGYGIPNFKKAFADLLKRTASGNITVNGCAVDINWTAKADTSATFTIEKQVAGGATTTIASIKGTGAGFNQKTYNIKDTVISSAAVAAQYFIRETLSNDTTVIIHAATVNITSPCFGGDGNIMVSPNPINDNKTLLSITTPGSINKLGLRVVDIFGHTLYQFNGQKSTGPFFHSIPTVRWPAGIYFILVYDDQQRIFEKKIVKY